MRCPARQPGRARRQLARVPWRSAGAATALLTATLTVNLDAWAQTAPAGPSDAPVAEKAEADNAPEPPAAPPSKPRASRPRLGDIVLPAARPEPGPEDDTSLDQLEPRDEGGFLYPYPPAKELRPPAPEPPRGRRRTRKRETERRWYGWQTLIVDTMNISALSLAAVFADDYATQQSLAEIGLLGYFAGPPVVHWTNGQAGKGFASLAIRVGSFAALVGLEGCFGDEAGPQCLLGISGLVGLIAAIPIDAAVLAYKEVPRERRSQAPFRFELASITPVVDVAHRWMGLRAGGRF